VQRKYRLTRSTDFKRVRHTGKSYAHPFVVLVVKANEISELRVGVTAGRSLGGAVRRNRSKRLLREAMRPMLPDLPTGWDLILIARSPLPSKPLQEIRAVLENLLRRANLYPAPHEG
jgi:ribonuclease P protein component